MTRDEWDAMTLIIENGWAGTLDEDQANSYFVMLARFDADDVTQALFVLAESGKPHIPTVPEITVAVNKVKAKELPSWTEAWNVIQKSLRLRSAGEAEKLLRDHHPTVRNFVALEGWDRLRREPFYDPDYGGLRIKELSQRWKDYSETSASRERTQRALGGSRSNRALGRMNPDALLPSPE